MRLTDAGALSSVFRAFLCVLSVFLAPLTSYAQTKYPFDLPAQPLAESLRAVGHQTSTNVMFEPRLVKGLDAPAVRAETTPAEAIGLLLAGTKLTALQTAADTILIQRVSTAEISQPTSQAVAPTGTNGDTKLAQAESSSPTQPPPARASAANAEDSGQERIELEEIVVTGTNIRGVKNDTSPVIVLDRQYISRSGFSNAQQVIESLPQNFKGGSTGASEDGLLDRGQFAFDNRARGAGVNLRGLGTDATLVLINGRRMAPSANGRFVDVSGIPVAAIERVEVLTDGASAIYGSDAVAGVTNIILRKDFDGAETSLHYGRATGGSPEEQRVSQAFGGSWPSGHGLVTADYYERDPLDVSDRTFSAGGTSPSYLLPDREQGSVLVNLNQALAPNVDLAVNGFYTREDIESVYSNVIGGRVELSPRTDQSNLFVGIGYDSFGDWRFEIGGALSRVDLRDAQTNLSPSGIVQVRQDDIRQLYDQRSVDLKGDGSLFELPAGSVHMAAGVSYREDSRRSSSVLVVPPLGLSTSKTRRDVTSAFAELYVPVIGQSLSTPGMRRLDLSLAARYDDYSDFGSTTNPKIGIVWTPVDGLDVRASYSTSFRAPTFSEMLPPGPGSLLAQLFTTADGSGRVPGFRWAPQVQLSAEKSKNLTLGLSWRPASVRGFELSASYFDIDYRDRIRQPSISTGNALARLDEFGPLLSHFTSDAQAQAFLDTHRTQGGSFLDLTPGGTGAAGVRFVFDEALQNIARVRVSGFDVTSGYSFAAGGSAFDLNLNLSLIDEMLNAITATSRAFDAVDTVRNPLDLRVRGMGTWSRGGVAATLAVNYSDDYVDDSGIADVPVASWTTVDLNLSYHFADRVESSIVSDLKLSLSVQNVFDEPPPRAGTLSSVGYSLGYDPSNANPLGRFIAFGLTKRW